MLDTPGMGDHHVTRRSHEAHQFGSWITHSRGPRIAQISDPGTFGQMLQSLSGALRLVVLMNREQLLAIEFQAIGAKKRLGVASVLARNEVHLLEHVQGAKRDVGQVANGGRHHIQGTGREVLVPNNAAGDAQCWGVGVGHVGINQGREWTEGVKIKRTIPIQVVLRKLTKAQNCGL